MKRIINILIISALLVSCGANKNSTKTSVKQESNELVFLSVNDMHSQIQNMPTLAYVVDSLRVIYPDLILVSAGDNRTGNVYNDRCPIHSNYPMISLMNDLEFNISELGNHEFDGSINGLQYFLDNTNFPVVCANGDFSAYPELKKMQPYVKFNKRVDNKDVSIIMLGMIETANFGYPSAHRDSIKDVHFVNAEEKIREYLPLKDSCDVFVLLSHCGIEVDTVFARIFPEFDLIIGGHSHDLVTKQFSNGVLYTQSKNKLKYATVTKLTFEDGKIIKKDAQPIDLSKVTKVNAKIQKKVDEFYDVPEFNIIVGYSKVPFASKDELGAYMVDAQRYVAKTDIAFQNPGGVRYGSTSSNELKITDILNLDPFNNSLVTGVMTGKQVEEFLNAASTYDYGPTHVSGITYTIEYFLGDDNNYHFVNAKAYLENGEPIDPEKEYTVALNSYMAVWTREMGIPTNEIGISANEAEFQFLKDFKTIDYQGVSRYKATSIQK